jgi:Pentapeptide repeats (9 copies)
LELVALYVDGNPAATFAPATRDPLGPLLELVCERENARQQLKISAAKQMQIFEELFRDSSDDISRSDLAFYVQYNVPEVTKDALTRFESHAFLSPGHDVKARFETLKVYFVARWLANRLEAAISEPSSETLIAELLERNASGNTDVFDFLLDRFSTMDPGRARAAITHAVQMTQSRSRSDGAVSALFHLAQRLAHRLDSTKNGRTSLLFGFLGVASPVRRVSVQGQISGLDLSEMEFIECNFKDAEFHNCTFNESTKFEGSRFDGILSFENCRLSGQARLVNCILSEDAEREWDRQAGKASRSAINHTVAKDALREILRRFIGPYGFSSIKEVDRNSGIIMRNPCGDFAWEELLKAKILERHHISGVSAGGLNIVDNPDVKHEVRSFLDNAALGPRLQRVIEGILKQS